MLAASLSAVTSDVIASLASDQEIREMRCQAASSSVVTVAVIQLLCIDRSVHWMWCQAASL